MCTPTSRSCSVGNFGRGLRRLQHGHRPRLLDAARREQRAREHSAQSCQPAHAHARSTSAAFLVATVFLPERRAQFRVRLLHRRLADLPRDDVVVLAVRDVGRNRAGPCRRRRRRRRRLAGSTARRPRRRRCRSRCPAVRTARAAGPVDSRPPSRVRPAARFAAFARLAFFALRPVLTDSPSPPEPAASARSFAMSAWAVRTVASNVPKVSSSRRPICSLRLPPSPLPGVAAGPWPVAPPSPPGAPAWVVSPPPVGPPT